MKQYLLTIYQPDGEPPPPPFLENIMRNVNAVNAEMKAAGAWVFAAALFPAHTSTVLHAKGDDVLMTDGPYTEGKEHVGGFSLIQAPDLDAALGWARKLARAITLPIEVRPIREMHR